MQNDTAERVDGYAVALRKFGSLATFGMFLAPLVIFGRRDY
jgi:hypothetical protein